ncbi:hypothetical protein K435DRAFT_779133 [Dendrothele bispora CBS 962.96]|uniref:Uncharacterized protein n=1 Tax=Dendrothele bispora (strain CBS 962.96) TaxID=1314807 RepID=A0A4S8LZI3_DENBC|nr:hypothetical protein K435DRAFT_779133 [Dendrothele bispora CBS 962.96]
MPFSDTEGIDATTSSKSTSKTAPAQVSLSETLIVMPASSSPSANSIPEPSSSSPSKGKGKGRTTRSTTTASLSDVTAPSTSGTRNNSRQSQLETSISDLRDEFQTHVTATNTNFIEVQESIRQFSLDSTEVQHRLLSMSSTVESLRFAHNAGIEQQNNMLVRLDKTNTVLQRIEMELQNLSTRVQSFEDVEPRRKRVRSESSPSAEIRLPTITPASVEPAPLPTMPSAATVVVPTPLPPAPASALTSTPATQAPPPFTAPPVPAPAAHSSSRSFQRAPEFGVRIGPIVLTGYRNMNEAAMAVLSILRGRNRLSQHVRGRHAGVNSLLMTWRSEAEAVAFFNMWHEEEPAGYGQVSVSLNF